MKNNRDNNKLVEEVLGLLEQDDIISHDPFFTGKVMMNISESGVQHKRTGIPVKYAFALALALLLMINIVTIYQNYQDRKQEIIYRQEAISSMSTQYFSN